MQTILNLAGLALHVCLKSKGVQACDARRRNRRGHAQTALLLDNVTSLVMEADELQYNQHCTDVIKPASYVGALDDLDHRHLPV